MTDKRLIETCDECKFFKKDNEDGGACRRNPPIPVGKVYNHGEDTEFETMGPWVDNNGWCGEFVLNEEVII